MTPNQMRAWRWLALVTVIANVAFNYLSESVLAFGDDSRVVTDRFESLFRPANYAFSIWGLIYGTFVAYAVYALTPSQRDVRLHDRLSVPLVVANVLASLFVVAFRYSFIGQSLTIMIATVIAASMLYVRSRDASFTRRSYEDVSSFVSVPFSLLLGWICVAALANLVIFTKWAGLEAGSISGEVTWTTIMLVVAATLGIGIGARNRDGIVPAVVSWASFAIWAHDRSENHAAAGIALAVGIVTGVVGVYYITTSSFMAYQLRREKERRSVAIVAVPKSSRA